MNEKIKKMYRITKKQIAQNENQFYFDNGKICLNYDVIKDKIKYSVMLVNTNVDTNDYIVYLLMINKNKSIPQLLVKSFNEKQETQKYFEELCDLVNNNSNYDIVNKCYDWKFDNNKKNKFSIKKFFNRKKVENL